MERVKERTPLGSFDPTAPLGFKELDGYRAACESAAGCPYCGLTQPGEQMLNGQCSGLARGSARGNDDNSRAS